MPRESCAVILTVLIQSNPFACTPQVVQTCFGGLEVGSCEPSSPNWLIDFLDVSMGALLSNGIVGSIRLQEDAAWRASGTRFENKTGRINHAH